MAIVNCTPHVINIYSSDDTSFVTAARKLVIIGMPDPIEVIEPSGTLLNAKQTEEDAEPLNGIPCRKFTFTSADSLPDGDDYFVVSALYVSGCKAMGIPTDRLLTVRGTIYASTDQPKPVGCLGFYRN
jgi:hypothetical protein